MITIHVTRLRILGHECAGPNVSAACGARSGMPKPTFAEIQNDSQVLLSVNQYAVLLPSDKKSAILDIAFGGGWF